jgi:hypothetical protein
MRTDRQRFSVAEPAPDDALNLNDYYDPRVLAPLHLINVTLNQTVDPAEQLVQRDRKASRGASDRLRAGAAGRRSATAGRCLRAIHRRRTSVPRNRSSRAAVPHRRTEMAQARTVGD